MLKKMKNIYNNKLSYGEGKKMTKPYVHSKFIFLFNM